MAKHSSPFSTKTRTLARLVRQQMKKSGVNKKDIDVVACLVSYGKSFNATALAGALANSFKSEIVHLREKKPTDIELKEKKYISHSYDDSTTVYSDDTICNQDYNNKNVLVVVEDVGDGKTSAASCELLEHYSGMRVVAVTTENVKTYLNPHDTLDEWALVYLNETREAPQRGRKKKSFH